MALVLGLVAVLVVYAFNPVGTATLGSAIALGVLWGFGLWSAIRSDMVELVPVDHLVATSNRTEIDITGTAASLPWTQVVACEDR